jgi:hypothetical protein
MNEKPEQSEQLTDSLAEGIAAVIAAAETLGEQPEAGDDLADLFLGELNRLWAEQPAGEAA